MSNKKYELKDLFKTPLKIKKPTYNSLNNKIKEHKRLNDETSDMMIILYCFIFLFFLVFIMTVIHTDDISKYSYTSPPQKYSLWESIKMRIFGIPKDKLPPRNCYIKSKREQCLEKQEDKKDDTTSSCVNEEGKSCQQINEEWSKGLLANNTKNENNSKKEKECPTEKYPHNIEIDAVNQCLKQ